MSNVDVISEVTGTSLALADLSKDAKRFAGAAKANAMIDAYASDVADFERVCALHELAALPAEPQTVGGPSPPSPSRAGDSAPAPTRGWCGRR